MGKHGENNVPYTWLKTCKVKDNRVYKGSTPLVSAGTFIRSTANRAGLIGKALNAPWRPGADTP